MHGQNHIKAVVRYLNSERERDVHVEHSQPKIKFPKRYNFLWN